MSSQSGCATSGKNPAEAAQRWLASLSESIPAATRARPQHRGVLYQGRYEGKPLRPGNWNFTADDLTALLRRINERDQNPADGPPADLAPAA
ncbi:MAG: hypothetical protein L0H84_09185 [Pseudonocardia sp.]|nr:hypothetical protein [Pseudonocardia sp.]